MNTVMDRVLEAHTDTITAIDTSTGNHDKFSHIVVEGYRATGEDGEDVFVPSGNGSAVEGVVTGAPVRALCGKVWVPTELGDRYPLCPMCKDIAASRGWKVPAA